MAQKEFDKYVVFKKEDLEYVLGEHRLLKKMFETTEVLVGLHRIAHNKKPQNKYIVCNQDEPYSEEVWKIILDGETKKEEGRG